MSVFADVHRLASLLANDPELMDACVQQRIVCRLDEPEWNELRACHNWMRMSQLTEDFDVEAYFVGPLRVERRK